MIMIEIIYCFTDDFAFQRYYNTDENTDINCNYKVEKASKQILKQIYLTFLNFNVRIYSEIHIPRRISTYVSKYRS